MTVLVDEFCCDGFLVGRCSGRPSESAVVNNLVTPPATDGVDAGPAMSVGAIVACVIGTLKAGVGIPFGSSEVVPSSFGEPLEWPGVRVGCTVAVGPFIVEVVVVEALAAVAGDEFDVFDRGTGSEVRLTVERCCLPAVGGVVGTVMPFLAVGTRGVSNVAVGVVAVAVGTPTVFPFDACDGSLVVVSARYTWSRDDAVAALGDVGTVGFAGGIVVDSVVIVADEPVPPGVGSDTVIEPVVVAVDCCFEGGLPAVWRGFCWSDIPLLDG